ncbi:glycosyltransferase [Chitinophaga tropicalis]|uniref:Glycosyltransferase n=1 Tax=Chitinophaga tropicalis TaxID=2683588 RepID=A0A7K1U3U5_9BACT|nr:glycosyltransferase [Chitinophaga tropicalis]MVT09032.1 glycosyltransferase [Chitinophaga tropicalis]
MLHPEKLSATTFTSGKLAMPVFNPEHLLCLTDATGVMQHALRSLPNRKEGYCTDDNARALLLTIFAWKLGRYPGILKLMPVYLSFVHYMQREDGYFDNFMSYNKAIIPNDNSEDAYGRALMALGYLICDGPSMQYKRTGEELFMRAYPHIHGLVSLRGIANSLIGLCRFITHAPDNRKRETVSYLADKLITEYARYSDNEWKWFEDILAYDNAIIPLALLHAYEVTQYPPYLKAGLESGAFLESKVFRNDILCIIGSNGWYRKNQDAALFDQQPVDAMALVLFYQQAFYVTGNREFAEKMNKCYQWFTGRNILCLSLYDAGTGGCADGLQEDRVSENQGAESTIAYWISHFAVCETLDK